VSPVAVTTVNMMSRVERIGDLLWLSRLEG
jgi:hypothetical protein